MKVWEFEEGKIYKTNRDETYKLEDGKYKVKLGDKWKESSLSINTFVDMYFEEVIDTNSHWKPIEDDCLFISYNFNVLRAPSWVKEDINQFHTDDKEKVKCLALEFKIKSILLNWRRLHDDVELDRDRSSCKYVLNYDNYDKKVHPFMATTSIATHIGYFSSKGKAQQFYEYMKEDIDKYFEMRKELMF